MSFRISRMKLKTYLSKNGISDEQAAKDLDVSESTIYFWTTEREKYKVVPGAKNLAAIQKYSDGQVTPNDFFE